MSDTKEIVDFLVVFNRTNIANRGEEYRFQIKVDIEELINVVINSGVEGDIETVAVLVKRIIWGLTHGHKYEFEWFKSEQVRSIQTGDLIHVFDTWFFMDTIDTFFVTEKKAMEIINKTNLEQNIFKSDRFVKPMVVLPLAPPSITLVE